MRQGIETPRKRQLLSDEEMTSPESSETRKGLRITQIETVDQTMRGALFTDPSDSDIRRIKIGYPIELAGREIEIKKSSLTPGQCYEFREKNGTWQQSTPLQAIATWEAGERATFDDLERQSHFPNSHDLPSNPYTGKQFTPKIYESYESYLKAYEWHPKESSEPIDRKFTFAFEHGMGWKAHLNATPEHAVAISEYLKANGYEHKFLSGGDASDGKVFTVYFGSKQKLDQWAPVISKELGEHLTAPAAMDETEAARGLAARFDPGVKRGQDFFRYGYCGVPVMRGDTPDQSLQFRRALIEGTRADKVEVARISYDRLKQMYGSYFTG